MTSLKTKNIWFLAAFLFLSIVPTLCKVVNLVSDCKQFLHQGTPPNIPKILEDGKIQDQNRYKVICQTFSNEPRYLTVYDTNYKIPVFSAYEYKGPGPSRSAPWKIEPQLEDKAKPGDTNMKTEGHGTYDKQAVDNDYKKNGKKLDRGHLFPFSHASTHDDQTSTFTLTNAVPQHQNFNRGRWNTMEQCTKCIMDHYINTGMQCFAVVGAIPSDNNKPDNKLNNKVNIPSKLWSAFYCSDTKSSIAGAHWDDNVESNPPKRLLMEPLKELNDKLKVNVFPKYPSGKVISTDEAVSAAGCSTLCSTQQPSGPSAPKRPRSTSPLGKP